MLWKFAWERGTSVLCLICKTMVIEADDLKNLYRGFPWTLTNPCSFRKPWRLKWAEINSTSGADLGILVCWGYSVAVCVACGKIFRPHPLSVSPRQLNQHHTELGVAITLTHASTFEKREVSYMHNTHFPGLVLTADCSVNTLMGHTICMFGVDH